MSSGSRKQDYIARIRYQNELPPPPCPPKLMDIPVDTSKLTSSTFLSDSMRQRKINMQIDMDLGMPLDLTEVPGIFYDGDESGVYAEEPRAQLDPKDSALIRDPAGKLSSKTTSSVAFLRRTEYISSEALKQTKAAESKAAALAKQKQEENVDPEEILRTVESTFDSANTNITTVRHPRKKHLRPVESWSLLPDTKMFDVQYVTVRMVGSASLSSHKRKYSDIGLSTALFKQSAIENDEWMSLYVADDDDSSMLKERIDSNVDTLEEDTKAYRFTRVQDNDAVLEQKRPEIILTFDKDEQKALYVNVAGQASLKRRRVVKHRRELVNESNVAQIDLSLREITALESNARDEGRAEFDPINYDASTDV